MSEQPTVSISLERKINTGRYESAAIFISVSGLPVDATAKDIAALLDTGRIAYDEIRKRLVAEIQEVRAGALES